MEPYLSTGPNAVWQARTVGLPQPDSALPHLADVVPSVLSAMGAEGFDGPIDLSSNVFGACVLLVDGLGAELLDAHSDDAPVMAALRVQDLHVGFPSTTTAGLAAIGTGCRSGEHGMVGYSFRVPGAGVVNALRWRHTPGGTTSATNSRPSACNRMRRRLSGQRRRESR